MKRKIISIIVEPALAHKMSPILGRLLGLDVELCLAGSTRRLIKQIVASTPDAIVYAWAGRESALLQWLKEQNLRRGEATLQVFSCQGFSATAMPAINHMIVGECSVRVASYAA